MANDNGLSDLSWVGIFFACSYLDMGSQASRAVIVFIVGTLHAYTLQCSAVTTHLTLYVLNSSQGT